MTDPKPPRPRVVPGIPGAKLPPPPEPRAKQTTFPELPSALPKRPERTIVGAGGPPAVGSGPSPRDAGPLSTTLESNEPQGVPAETPSWGQPEPRVHTPPSFESPAVQARAKRVIERQGDRVEVAPESLPSERPSAPAAASRGDQPWWRTAKGMAVVLPIMVTSATGFLGGLTAAVVVPIVKAVREPHEGAKAKDIAEAKAAGERCDAAVTSERAARLASQEAIRADAAKLDAKVSELANQLPAVKPDPSRPPRN